MKERPILMSAPMVRAILDGRKTQTRRIVKPQFATQSVSWGCKGGSGFGFFFQGHEDGFLKCPYGSPGDRLWVREKHAVWERDSWIEGGVTITPPERGVYYWAEQGAMHQVGRWTPSIHMPRWASRITLEVVSVRVERLKDISENDAIAEGIETVPVTNSECVYRDYRKPSGEQVTAFATTSYKTLWDSINGPGSWDANPWVWVIEFRPAAKGCESDRSGNPARSSEQIGTKSAVPS